MEEYGHHLQQKTEGERGREGGREGEREREREREGGREGGREGEREGESCTLQLKKTAHSFWSR